MVSPAWAQDETASADATEDEIIVTGLRANLDSAQNIKRNADTVVDSITSEDMGSFPDKSVAEALQRVPGVSISRFAAANDPDHFSVEGSGVVVRGLNFVRSEFNGRDAFSVNTGRALGFNDVSPELLASVRQATEDLKAKDPVALVLSGGPPSVYADGAPHLDPEAHDDPRS